jgi:hypothetical protein
MPRNSAGVYTLPLGNPVIPNTIIESDGWANPTLSDIGNEITNSLDRSGRGGMTGPFGVVDGSPSAPGLRFTTDPNNGLYREGVDDWWLVAGSVPVVEITPTLVSVPDGIDLQLLTAIPPNAASAVRKDYVDAAFDAADLVFLKKSGGTMTGPITFDSDAPNGLVFKNATSIYTFVDSLAVYLPAGKSWAWNGVPGFLGGIDDGGIFSLTNVIQFTKATAGTVKYRNFANTTYLWGVGVSGVADDLFGVYNYALSQWAMYFAPNNGAATFLSEIYAGGNLTFKDVQGPRFKGEDGSDKWWIVTSGNPGDDGIGMYNLGTGTHAWFVRSDNSVLFASDIGVTGYSKAVGGIRQGTDGGIGTNITTYESGGVAFTRIRTEVNGIWSSPYGEVLFASNGAVTLGGLLTVNNDILATGTIACNNSGVGFRSSQDGVGFARFRTEAEKAVIEAFNWPASVGARCSLDAVGVFRAKQFTATPNP